jgi:hypothetical protein
MKLMDKRGTTKMIGFVFVVGVIALAMIGITVRSWTTPEAWPWTVPEVQARASNAEVLPGLRAQQYSDNKFDCIVMYRITNDTKDTGYYVRDVECFHK